MNIYVSDIDGTFCHKEKVHKDNYSTFSKLKDDGHIIIFASGRSFELITEPFEEKFYLLADYLICENGAEIYIKNGDNFELVYNNSFTTTESIDFYTIFKDDNVSICVVERPRQVYVNKIIKNSELVKSICGFDVFGLSYIKHVRKETKNKQILFGDTEVLKSLIPKVPEQYEVAFSSDFSLEITKKGVSKAAALEYIIKNYIENCDLVFGFGDSGNDVKMLEYVDVSVAMLNGSTEAKNAATYTTDLDASSGGLADFIKKYENNQIKNI